MVYLRDFNLISEVAEHFILCDIKHIYNTYYPFGLFPQKEFQIIDFEPITIFYGGNGSGKTTLLNIISSKLRASRKNVNKLGELFDTYVNRCYFTLEHSSELREIKFISSDDVFDYLLDVRAINSEVNRRKEALSKEYLDAKFGSGDIAFSDYENLKRRVEYRKMTQSKYIRSRLTNNTYNQQSNGESALEFWEREIQDNGIYILDEPENSLSAENQIKLKKFIEDSARFYNCQFIISTHSPFMLSLDGARVYNLDRVPVKSEKWVDLPNVKVYYDFFKLHSNEFNK